MTEQIPSLTKFQIWMMAARLKTLPAAAASTILGSAIAYRDGKFNLIPALSALLISILIQIGANFANDLFDFQHGVDKDNRMGPIRVTQSGLLLPRQVIIGMLMVFGISTLLGLYLAWVVGWWVIVIGISAIFAALAYTGGPFPYGYYSLGDLFVFIFFGIVAVCGAYFVQALTVSVESIWGGFAMGFLITNILVVNNLRDIETDRAANKITLAVKLGINGTKTEYLICIILAYIIPIILTFGHSFYFGSLLSWFSLPLAIRQYLELNRFSGRLLNKTLAGTAQLALIYALLFSIGILIFQ